MSDRRHPFLSAWLAFSALVVLNVWAAWEPLTWLLAITFIALETYAILHPAAGDTLSEQIYQIPIPALRWLIGIFLSLQVIIHIHWLVGLAVFAWLPVHLTLKRLWYG